MVNPEWLKTCGDIRGLRVLDLGCGGGDCSILLAGKGAKVVGVDKDSKMIEIAKEREGQNPRGIEYMQGDAVCLPNFKEKFDLICPTSLLHYSETKEELKNMIFGVARNLKIGGKMVAINNDPEKAISDYSGSFVKTRWLDDPWVEGSEIEAILKLETGTIKFRKIFWWKEETYNNFLTQAGFTNIQWIRPRTNDEGKRLYSNWKELEDNYCIKILVAKKI